MPFTFAHPAIVLPCGIKHTKYIDFTTIVIGTMAPDFEYFINFRPIQIVGHTLLGQIYLNLPITIILAFIYHYILKEAVITNVPKPFCDRYYYLVGRRWRISSLSKFLVVCYSALLGAFTHLMWDGFTHENGFFVVKIKLLSEYVNILNFKVPIYKILQHGSTLLGFLTIMIYMFVIQNRKVNIDNHMPASKFTKIKYWSGIIVIGMIILVIMIFQQESFSIGGFIVIFINSMFIGLMIMSLASRLRAYQKKLGKTCTFL